MYLLRSRGGSAVEPLSKWRLEGSGRCGWRKLPAVSVSEGGCGCRASSRCSQPSTVQPEGTQGREKGQRSWSAKGHVKGVISLSPHSCIFPHMEKYETH